MERRKATRPVECAKGYRQLAAETHLDKDTVRDLIADFKAKGMVREIGGYNPDTRSPKTYEVLSSQAILKMWREAGPGVCHLGPAASGVLQCSGANIPVSNWVNHPQNGPEKETIYAGGESPVE